MGAIHIRYGGENLCFCPPPRSKACVGKNVEHKKGEFYFYKSQSIIFLTHAYTHSNHMHLYDYEFFIQYIIHGMIRNLHKLKILSFRSHFRRIIKYERGKEGSGKPTKKIQTALPCPTSQVDAGKVHDRKREKIRAVQRKEKHPRKSNGKHISPPAALHLSPSSPLSLLLAVRVSFSLTHVNICSGNIRARSTPPNVYFVPLYTYTYSMCTPSMPLHLSPYAPSFFTSAQFLTPHVFTEQKLPPSNYL